MDKDNKDLTIEYTYLSMTLILNEHQCHKFIHLAKEKKIHGIMVLLGKGTVKNVALHWLGIKSQKRQIVSMIVKKEDALDLLDYFSSELQLNEPGHGIAYMTPIATAKQIINKQGAWDRLHDVEVEYMYKKLTVIVNRGMAEDVMDIARKSGVTGGTIIHGRGTGSEYTEKLFGIEIEPEKELVMILMPGELVEKVVSDIYQELNLENPGNGILFVEPVVEVRGLLKADKHKNEE